jgi:DNA topoisomerase IA
MKVVVVESPAKAKTINKYLGSGYEVIASFGHIRDLPAKDGSVDPDAEFAMQWEIEAKSSKRVSDIAAAVKGSDGHILATDPDREGEAISWHIVEALNARREFWSRYSKALRRCGRRLRRLGRRYRGARERARRGRRRGGRRRRR